MAGIKLWIYNSANRVHVPLRGTTTGKAIVVCPSPRGSPKAITKEGK